MIVRLKGGLGNQMFQYAFVRGLQIKYGVNDVSLDDLRTLLFCKVR